jgi:hypothetical protein
VTSHSGEPAGPAAEGDLRFDDASGGLEVFDGKEWRPLQRIPDLDQPPIFRSGGPELRQPEGESDGAAPS